MKTLALTCITFFLSLPFFAQDNSPKEAVYTRAIRYFSQDGDPISKEQYEDSLKTGKYQLLLTRNDTLFLVSKVPRGIRNKQLPIVDFKDINGKTVRYGESGKITLLSFWRTDAYDGLFGDLKDLITSYPDVRIIALTPDSASKTNKFLKENNISWQNITIVPEYKNELGFSFHWFVSVDIVTDHNCIVREIFVDEDRKKAIKYMLSNKL